MQRGGRISAKGSSGWQRYNQRWCHFAVNSYMIRERTINETLAALLAGGELQGDPKMAEAFLRALMEQSPQETWKVIVPVARRLMSFPGWYERLDVATVREHCLQRCEAAARLRDITDYDAEIEFLAGIAQCLSDRWWLFSAVEREPIRSPDTPGPADRQGSPCVSTSAS